MEQANEQPTVSPDHLRYIRSLNEAPGCYARFFDALLVKRSSHVDFFHDLKQFREQTVVIGLLQQGTKNANRETTRVFIGSRFAHPWCRITSDFQSGWTKASWTGRTKKADEAAIREEDRLHSLLVPIWIAFRRRMFPGDEVLEQWVVQELQRQEQESIDTESEAAKLETGNLHLRTESPLPPTTQPPVYPELGFATKSSTSKQNLPSNSGGAAAAQMFLGMAVTGFIMGDKRVKKYVEKKLKK